MRTPKCLIEKFEDEYSRIENQERLKEEVSQAIFALLEYNNERKADLARKLNCSPAYVSKILSGSHNFTLESLADIFMALGRAAHLRLDLDTTNASNALDTVNASSGPSHARHNYPQRGIRSSYPENHNAQQEWSTLDNMPQLLRYQYSETGAA